MTIKNWREFDLVLNRVTRDVERMRKEIDKDESDRATAQENGVRVHLGLPPREDKAASDIRSSEPETETSEDRIRKKLGLPRGK